MHVKERLQWRQFLVEKKFLSKTATLKEGEVRLIRMDILCKIIFNMNSVEITSIERGWGY